MLPQKKGINDKVKLMVEYKKSVYHVVQNFEILMLFGLIKIISIKFFVGLEITGA